MEDSVYVVLPEHFRLEEITAIGQSIERAGLFIPGYRPPAVGLTNPIGMIYAKVVEGYRILVLPDRNLVSRMALLAKGQPFDLNDSTVRNAISVMAYCRGMDLDFEPSIAYHELAHRDGNDAAHDELEWFRAADNHNTDVWIDLAVGRTKKISPMEPILNAKTSDLAFPLHRWKRNYAVVLKIAALELSDLKPSEKSLALLRWMEDDFIIAGPAAMFSQIYFSPHSEKRRMLKSLRSPTRKKALEGAKNAAWDITYLSDFLRRVHDSGDEGRTRYIFATADKALAKLAPKLLLGSDPDKLQQDVSSEIGRIWNVTSGDAIAEKLYSVLQLALVDPPQRRRRNIDVDAAILEGERALLNWAP